MAEDLEKNSQLVASSEPQHQGNEGGLENPETPTKASGDDVVPIDPKKEARLLLKCDFNIVPILFCVYVLAFLDRINIGNARIAGMTADLKMKGNDYNVALLIFFIPYILLEVPSNIIMRKLKPSTWLTFLMFFWGVTSMCQGLTKSYGGLVACRFFMGIFEAGVFPGCIYLLSMYYKRAELQKRYTAFFSSGLVAGAFGGLLAYALGLIHHGSYKGWRWIFIVEGLITIGFAPIFWLFIADWPETARFLNEEERALIVQRLKNDGELTPMDTLNKFSLGLILKDWKIYVGTLMYMGIAVSGYSTAFFVPTILLEFGWMSNAAQVHTIPVYVVCTAVTLLAAWLSDRARHRYLFIVFGAAWASVGYIILLAQGGLSREVKYMAVFFVLSGVYIVQPMTIVWLANNLGGHWKRAVGTATQIGLGNVGGIVGSVIYITDESPRYPRGYGTALAMLLFSAIMCTVFELGLRAENRKREAGKRDDRLGLSKEQLENMGDYHPSFRFML